MVTTLSFNWPRRTASVLALSAAMGFGYLVATLHAHDIRLDEAFQALQKAQALVEASSTGGEVNDQAQHQFDRHRERALVFIARAMEEVVMAADAGDAGIAAGH